MAVRQGREAGRWVVEFQAGGQRVFERLPPGVTKAQAVARETQLRRELFDGKLGRHEVTIAEAIGSWLLAGTRRNQRQAESEARQWEPWAGRLLREAPEVAQEAVGVWSRAVTRSRAIRLRSVSSTDAPIAQPNAWPAGSDGSKLTIRSSQKARTADRDTWARTPTPATINRRLALLKAVCKHTWKQGQIGENLSGRITLLREDNKREVYLTREEIARLAKCAPSQSTSSAIWLLAYTGMRVSELLSQPRPTRGASTLYVATSKSGKPRHVPIAKPVSGHLSALPLELDYWRLRKEFLVARRKAGLSHVRIHDLRHTCASWLINAGVDLYTVGKILGHSGPATTARYAHLSTQTLEKAMRRLK